MKHRSATPRGKAVRRSASIPSVFPPGVSRRRWIILAAAFLAGALCGVLLMNSERPASMIPFPRSLKKASALSDLRGFLRSMNQERNADRLIAYGIDTLSFLRAAEEEDGPAAGLDPHDWELILQNAHRESAKSGSKFVAVPSGVCPSPCAVVDSEEECRRGAQFLGFSFSQPANVHEPNDEDPPGCHYRSNYHPEKRLQFNPSVEVAGSASVDNILICRCASWPVFIASMDGTGCQPPECVPISERSTCEEAAFKMGLSDTRSGVTGEEYSRERPAGCHYRERNEGVTDDLWFNPVMTSPAEASIEDFQICSCETGDGAVKPVEEVQTDAPPSTPAPEIDLTPFPPVSPSPPTTAPSPSGNVARLVLEMGSKTLLKVPAKESEVEQAHLRRSALRRSQSGDTAKYDYEEELATLALRAMPEEMKNNAGKAAGWVKYRIFDMQERLHIVATLYDTTPDKLIEKYVPADQRPIRAVSPAPTSKVEVQATVAPRTPVPSVEEKGSEGGGKLPLAAELKELAALHRAGALTDEEFSQAKAAAIKRKG
eukprot:Sspe_Gene.64152::Locus_37557_Transcript_1_1_Confidence_1.000_Length_1762::g.64152::m.64152